MADNKKSRVVLVLSGMEDIVRDIASKLDKDPNITWFAVESENFESIHNHNAYAYIEKHKDM